MSIELFFYLAGVVDALDSFVAIVAFISLGAIVIYTIILVCGDGMTSELFFKSYNLKVFLVPAVFGIMAAIIPNEKTMYMIAASSIGRDLVQSETGKKVHTLVDAKLDELISEISKK